MKFNFLRKLLPPYVSQSSAAKLFGFDMYGERSEKLWFKYTIQPIYDALKKIDNAYYWISYRTFDRYHIVDTGMKPGYKDVDEVMFHACFALLGKFVEIELGKPWSDNPDEFGGSSHRGYRLHFVGDSNSKAIDLWLWYKNELPMIIKGVEDDITDCYRGKTEFKKLDDGSGFSEMIFHNTRKPIFDHDYLDNLKSEKLQELIDMRRNLWT